MNNFSIDASMVAAISGAFYPTGYSVVMFPEARDAQHVGEQLIAGGMDSDEVLLMPPASILSQIGPTVRDADEPLPSAGTEGATVRAYIALAREGQTGLLVKTDDEVAAERLMAVARTVKYSMAQRYRLLVIEDL